MSDPTRKKLEALADELAIAKIVFLKPRLAIAPQPPGNEGNLVYFPLKVS